MKRGKVSFRSTVQYLTCIVCSIYIKIIFFKSICLIWLKWLESNLTLLLHFFCYENIRNYINKLWMHYAQLFLSYDNTEKTYHLWFCYIPCRRKISSSIYDTIIIFKFQINLFVQLIITRLLSWYKLLIWMFFFLYLYIFSKKKLTCRAREGEFPC